MARRPPETSSVSVSPVVHRPSPPGLRAAGRKCARCLHRICLHVRPTQLGALLKLVFRVRREYVQTRSGLWFWIDPASHLGQELLVAGQYEACMAHVIEVLLRPGDVFLDVGANEGYFTVLASRQVGDGRVLAIEPQTRLAGALLRNLEINSCRNVVLRSVALDGAPGWLNMYLRPSTNTGASGIFRRRIDASAETVMARCLDDVVAEEGIDRVRVLKVDCEGAEDRVVAGALRTLGAQRVDFILMEFHPTVGPDALERSQALHQRLRNLGYVMSQTGGRHIYHLPGSEPESTELDDLRINVEPTF